MIFQKFRIRLIYFIKLSVLFSLPLYNIKVRYSESPRIGNNILL